MTRVIAEIGVNHCGHESVAMDMVCDAKRAGCWGVKFQLYIPELLESDKARQDRLRRFMLTKKTLQKLRRMASHLGLAFGASCFDNPSIDLLESLSPDFQKLACGQWWPEHRWIKGVLKFQSERMPVGSWWQKDAEGDDGTIVLQCVPKYPAKASDYYPIARGLYERNSQWGVSDHTGCLDLAESLSREWWHKYRPHYAEVHTEHETTNGPDHAVSLKPKQLAAYVYLLTHPQCEMTKEIEEAFHKTYRKYTVLKRPIKGQKVAWLRGV